MGFVFVFVFCLLGYLEGFDVAFVLMGFFVLVCVLPDHGRMLLSPFPQHEPREEFRPAEHRQGTTKSCNAGNHSPRLLRAPFVQQVHSLNSDGTGVSTVFPTRPFPSRRLPSSAPQLHLLPFIATRGSPTLLTTHAFRFLYE